jgi:hypothetical protein
VVSEAQHDELAEEAEFYGLLDLMFPCRPYAAQELIGEALPRAASGKGTAHALQSAMAQVRSLIFVMGSTTPFLNEEFQDLKYVITDRVVNGSPVWAASNGRHFIYRGIGAYGTIHEITVDGDERCGQGRRPGDIYNRMQPGDIFAPTEVSPTGWVSMAEYIIESKFPSASPAPGTIDDDWVRVLEMRITVEHGLDDDHPAMAAARRLLAGFG